MAEPTTDLSNLNTLVASIQSAVVIVGPQPTLDQWATATALGLSLQQAGKSVLLAAPRKPVVGENSVLKPLNGLDKVATTLGKRDLVVSFAYDETAVDKVSYAIGAEAQAETPGGRRFYLTIKPKAGSPPLSSDTVEFSYAGVDADVIFLVGVHDVTQLGQLYLGYEELYANHPIVTIHTFAPEIGQIRLDTSKSSCSAEAMVQILADMGLSLTAEAATNLLYSIEAATDGLGFAATVETFRAVTTLLQAGARRFRHPNANKGGGLASSTSAAAKSRSAKIPAETEVTAFAAKLGG